MRSASPTRCCGSSPAAARARALVNGTPLALVGASDLEKVALRIASPLPPRHATSSPGRQDVGKTGQVYPLCVRSHGSFELGGSRPATPVRTQPCFRHEVRKENECAKGNGGEHEKAGRIAEALHDEAAHEIA